MKVVQLLPDLDGGGVERGTLEVAKALVDAGHESVVISAGGRMVAQLEAEGSRHVSWDLGKKSLWTFRHVWALRRWLRAERPDILHLRSRLPAWVAWFAWRGIKPAERPHLVTTVHGLYSVGRYSSIMCRGERVIAVSETVATYIRDNYPDTDRERVRLIYRGVEPSEFPYGFKPSVSWVTAWYTQYPQLQGKRVLTLAGRLTRLKGHHDLIDLVKSLNREGVPAHGLIVGGEDPKRRAYAAELRQRVADEGLNEMITFTGVRGDIREIYAVSDLVLSLSNKPESFGRTALEALRLGRPVLGYAHGGIGEILNAVFPEGAVKNGDQEQLRVATLQLLRSGIVPEDKATLFTKQSFLEETLALYRELCE